MTPPPDQNAAPAESMYPAVEEFIETAPLDAVDSLFASLRNALTDLKGPRKEHGKKVETAISSTEELLRYLLGVREELEGRDPRK